MNKSFANEERFISNKRIIEAYFTEVEFSDGVLKKLGDRVLAILASIVAFLTSARMVSIAKVVVFVGCLLGFLGLIGAMDCGKISLLVGLLLSAPILGIEYLCLKSYCGKRDKN